MGARPLSRKIDELIRVPLSKKILFDRLGDCAITVDWINDAVTFSHGAVPALTSSVDKNGIIQVEPTQS